MATQEQLQTYLTTFLQAWNASDKSKRAYGQAVLNASLRTGIKVRDKAGTNTIAVSQIPSYDSLIATGQAAPVTPGNNNNNINNTSASDDKSYDQLEAARLNNAKSNSDTNETNSNAEGNALKQSFAGQTQNGKANASAASPSNAAENNPSDKPGRRPYNPLSTFSSYNYQITLYMLAPETYNMFVRSGRTNLLAYASTDPNSASKGAGGLFIVAQSGGQGTTIPRPPGMELDYFIDNVKIQSFISSRATTTASVASEITFDIYEPYGFSLPTKLKLAADELNRKSKLPNVKNNQNPSRNMYVLGIRFLGYDEKGALIQSTTQQEGLFETYYEILIREFKFKLDGKTTVYNVKAVPTPTIVGFGAKRGRVVTGAMVTGQTVEDVLTGPDGLLTKLNQQQEQLAKKSGNNRIGIANKYNVEFVGPNADKIRNAKVMTDIDRKNKSIWPMSEAATKAQVNAYLSVSTKPSDTKRTISFGKDVSVQQAVSSIITTSDYLANALKLAFKNDVSTMTGKKNEQPNKPAVDVQWYNLSCSVECLGWDDIVGDFAYDITYWIMVYDTPNIVSAYVGKTPKYYGAYKKYDYWFTGKNSEIIRYEQQIDNSYFQPVIVPTGTSTSQSGGADVPTGPLTQPNLERTGGLNLSRDAENNYLTNLYDPTSFTKIKIGILGDPDFLLNDNPVTRTSQYKQFYGSDGYKINPNTGQVFIEVRFNEGIDYNLQSGTMSLNQNILFYQNPKSVPAGVSGVSFMVYSVESNFSQGSFTQTLDCNINIFSNPAASAVQDENKDNGRENPAATASSGAGNAAAGAGAGNAAGARPSGSNVTAIGAGIAEGVAGTIPNIVGLVPEPPVVPYSDASNLVNTDNNKIDIRIPSGPTQLTTPTGGSQNAGAATAAAVGLAEGVAGTIPTQITTPASTIGAPVTVGLTEGVAGAVTNQLAPNTQDTVRTPQQTFTATVTAADATTAEQLALSAAQRKATNEFGSATQFESFNQVRIKENSDPKYGVTSYTVTYSTTASGVEGTVPRPATPVINKNVANDDASSSLPVTSVSMQGGEREPTSQAKTTRSFVEEPL